MEVEMEEDEWSPPAAPGTAEPAAAPGDAGGEGLAGGAGGARYGDRLTDLQTLLDEARTIAHRLFHGEGERPEHQDDADGIRLAQIVLELDDRRGAHARAKPLAERIEPDTALVRIQDLVDRLHANLYTADDQALADGLELARRVRQLDGWLTGGGLFPATWEDSHPWVKLRRELANASARAEQYGRELDSVSGQRDRLSSRLEAGRKVLEEHAEAFTDPARETVIDAALAALDGRS